VARIALALLVIGILTAVAAGVGTRMGLWNATVGQFRIFPYALCLAVVAFLLGVAWIVIAFATGSGAGARYGVLSIVAAIALFWVPVRNFWMASVVHALPPIYDISTDTEHAPEFLVLTGIERNGALPVYQGMRRVAFEGHSYAQEALQKLYYGDIKPDWQLGTTADKLYKRALSGARAMGWRIVAAAPDGHGGRIQASDTTILFGLTDDIVIRVKPAGIGARLDIRSRSREDTPDFGRNAQRIRAYFKRLA
jgi:hypothetical protein